MTNETDIHAEAAAVIEAAKDLEDRLVEAVRLQKPSEVKVELAEAPKNGHCPNCKEPAPKAGMLVGPPWRHQIEHMRNQLAAHHEVRPEDVPDEAVLQGVLAMHGGLIVTCQGEDCGQSYLVRVTEWPKVKVSVS